MKITFRLDEQYAQQRIEKMGVELGALFNALQGELLRTRIYWSQYRELFGTNESRIDLLKRSGGAFWKIIEDVLWSHVLLSIARLLDRKEFKRGKRNLSIEALIVLVDHVELRERLNVRHAELKMEAVVLETWRNSSIAHLGHDAHFGLGETESGLSCANVEALLKGLEELMNDVQSHHMDSTFDYEMDYSKAGALSVLHLIRAGLKLQDKRPERLQSGRATRQDLLTEDPL